VSEFARTNLELSTLKLMLGKLEAGVGHNELRIQYGRTFELLAMNYLTCHHPSLTAKRKVSTLSELTFKPSNKTEPTIFRGKGMIKKMYDAMRTMPFWNPDIPNDNLDDLAFAFGTFPIIDFADARNRGFDTTINTYIEIKSKPGHIGQIQIKLRAWSW
jgi:hypothetical protein